MSELTLDIKTSPRKLKLNYTPSDKAILVHIKLKKMEKKWRNFNRWNENNSKRSERHEQS